jgi:hypothetical protein
METPGNDPESTEELWIAKYRAAMDTIPVQQSRLAKMHALLDTAWQAVVSRVCERGDAKTKRRNSNANVFAIPNPKAKEEKLIQGHFRNKDASKAS